MTNHLITQPTHQCLAGLRRLCQLVVETGRDNRGGSAILIALSFTGLIGIGGLATEAGGWYLTSRTMQGAADAAAISSAVAGQSGASDTQLTTEARTVAANYGFVNGTGGVTVAMNKPPTSGSHTGTSSAIEVVIQQPQNRLLSTLFLPSNPTIVARAVATPGSSVACVLALNRTIASAFSASGSTAVNLVNCSIADDSSNASALTVSGGASVTTDSVSVVGGISGTVTTTSGSAITGARVIADPYASLAVPSYSGCNQNNPSPVHSTVTWDAGGGTYVICNGLSVNATGILNLSNGVFVIDRGGISLAGGATLNVNNATVVLTSSTGSNWGTVTVNGGATITATAPTSGATSGIAFFQDRSAPAASNNFTGGSTQQITGAVYFPSQTVQYSGGIATGSGCTQVIADQVAFTGNSSVETNCTGKGVQLIHLASNLVE